mmetsp:Transcript_1684/g.5067  ORF Transcript_1684/g.5067 Transcript_1684/m.5067 type:complete len:151 (-) Transcript_1684:71-523(-)
MSTNIEDGEAAPLVAADASAPRSSWRRLLPALAAASLLIAGAAILTNGGAAATSTGAAAAPTNLAGIVPDGPYKKTCHSEEWVNHVLTARCCPRDKKVTNPAMCYMLDDGGIAFYKTTLDTSSCGNPFFHVVNNERKDGKPVLSCVNGLE